MLAEAIEFGPVLRQYSVMNVPASHITCMSASSRNLGQVLTGYDGRCVTRRHIVIGPLGLTKSMVARDGCVWNTSSGLLGEGKSIPSGESISKEVCLTTL